MSVVPALRAPQGTIGRSHRRRGPVALPLVPAFVRAHVPLAVPVEATAHGTFPRYADLSGWP
ncbi:hypothetical protein GCM10023221_17900 [Luteimicrobium xylanilyticum]